MRMPYACAMPLPARAKSRGVKDRVRPPCRGCHGAALAQARRASCLLSTKARRKNRRWPRPFNKGMDGGWGLNNSFHIWFACSARAKVLLQGAAPCLVLPLSCLAVLCLASPCLASPCPLSPLPFCCVFVDHLLALSCLALPCFVLLRICPPCPLLPCSALL